MKRLDAEEQAILDDFDAGALKPVARRAQVLKRNQQSAEATFAKDSRINIRISSKDLRLLQKRALSEGLPYQTLIASLLHKYVEGRLVDR